MQLTWSQICFHRLSKKKKDWLIFREDLTFQYPNRGRKGFPGGSEVKNPAAVPVTRVPSRVGRILGRREWPPLPYSCPESPTDRGAEGYACRIAKSQTWVKQLSTERESKHPAHGDHALHSRSVGAPFHLRTENRSPSEDASKPRLWLCYNSEFHQKGRCWVNSFHLSVQISIVMARTVVCTIVHPGVCDWVISSCF